MILGSRPFTSLKESSIKVSPYLQFYCNMRQANIQLNDILVNTAFSDYPNYLMSQSTLIRTFHFLYYLRFKCYRGYYQYFRSLEIIQIRSFLSVIFILMHRQHRKHLQRLASVEQDVEGGQEEGRLNSIIKTFRQNNLRLMQKIEECDRIRQMEHQLNQKKLSQRHLLFPFDPLPLNDHTLKRPLSQFKTQRFAQKALRLESRKENVAFEFSKRTHMASMQDGEQMEYCQTEQKNPKLVKISLNRLVPLNVQKLKERMKML